MFKKNLFKEAIKKAVSKWSNGEEKVIKFSNRLAVAMGLNEEAIKQAERHKVFWTLQNYEIHPACRYFGGGWIDVLEAVPRGTGCGYGYSNTQPATTDPRWTYEMRGTGTVIVAPAIIQEQILAEIRTIHKEPKDER